MIDVTPGLLERSPLLSMAVVDVLEETAQRVDREGFAQHAFWDPATGMYCTRGHFTRIAFDKYMDPDLGVDWKSLIAGCDMVMTGHLGRGVAVWNDEPGRTKEEVIAALTTVAAKVRAECAA